MDAGIHGFRAELPVDLSVGQKYELHVDDLM